MAKTVETNLGTTHDLYIAAQRYLTDPVTTKYGENGDGPRTDDPVPQHIRDRLTEAKQEEPVVRQELIDNLRQCFEISDEQNNMEMSYLGGIVQVSKVGRELRIVVLSGRPMYYHEVIGLFTDQFTIQYDSDNNPISVKNYTKEYDLTKSQQSLLDLKLTLLDIAKKFASTIDLSATMR